MKKSLLLLGVIAALAIGAPAYSQYIFLDVNNDAACTSTDLLNSSVSTVDVWLDTNHNANGTLRTCTTNPSQPLDIFSYDLVVHQAGSGSVTFNSWTNAATGFQPLTPLTVAGADAGVGYTAPLGGNLVAALRASCAAGTGGHCPRGQLPLRAVKFMHREHGLGHVLLSSRGYTFGQIKYAAGRPARSRSARRTS